jgi:hypothetical protein
VPLISLEGFDGGAYGDAARCEDVGSEAAAVNQFAQHALVRESHQVGAGLTKSTPDAFDVADPEALSDRVPLVEDEVDDLAHRGQACGPFGWAGELQADVRRRPSPFCPHHALGDGRSGYEKGTRTFRNVSCCSANDASGRSSAVAEDRTATEASPADPASSS